MKRFTRNRQFAKSLLFCTILTVTLVAVQGRAKADDEGDSGNLVAQLLQRVSALEAQQRELRGDLDQLNNQVRTQSDILAKKIDDAQFAARSNASPAVAEVKPSTVPSASKEGDDATPATAADLIMAGKTALRSRDFASSQSKARAAIKIARDQKAKVGARFLLAQSLAGLKDFKGSAVAYYDAYRVAPRADTAQESLLGVSAAMLALGRKKDACEALDKLHQDFSNPSARIKAAYNSFHRRASCN